MARELHDPKIQNMQKMISTASNALLKPYPAFPLPDWPAFNRMTGGFRMREYSILCGSTGTGKTTLLANISAQLIKANVKHLVMSVETGHEDYVRRVMSAFAAEDLNTGEPVDGRHLSEISAKNHQYFSSDRLELALYDDRLPLEQLVHDLEFAIYQRGCKIVMIDNLNFFMEVTQENRQVLEMDRVTHELIIFCKKHDVHIVMVMHPRKTEMGTRVESEFDIKGSSTAVQEAHNIFLLNRPQDKHVDAGSRDHTDRELTVKKMRRRGMYVGKSIVFSNFGTQYREKGFV